MSSIRKEIVVAASAGDVWDVVRDVGAVHRRFAPGFVTNTVLEDGARVVTFANGLVTRELIVDIDDQKRRLAYAATGGRLTHHNASLQVFEDEPARARLVWQADLLPNELAPAIDAMMEQGVDAIGRAFERVATT